MSVEELDPLNSLLTNVLTRLSNLEAAAGITPEAAKSAATSTATSATSEPATASPALVAYDAYITTRLQPFVQTCVELGDPDLLKITKSITQSWGDGIRTIIEAASLCQKPKGTNVAEALQKLLTPIQEAISSIRKIRMKNRTFDNHQRSIMELMAALGWVVIVPPPQGPVAFTKEAIGATEFWSNKIRKEFRGKNETQIKFCDAAKALIYDLVAYIKEFHLTGLTWNPKGGKLEEYTPGASPAVNAAPVKKPAGGGGGPMAIMNELSKKQTSDGSSAATGLKKVTRDMQTWRKEFKADTSKVVSAPSPSPSIPIQKKYSGGGGTGTIRKHAPVLQYEPMGNKWKVEYQTKDSSKGKPLEIKVKDVKEQVYLYQCNDVTVIVSNKLKNIIIDKCTKCNVVFDTVVSSVEIVNSQKVQVQTKGVCPSITIDKTDGFLAYLSKETVNSIEIVTSKSSEMNVSWEEANGEMKEAPIPEQFVSRFGNGVLKTDVSDLYH
eukprot:CAMPEP_0194355268 /NCGR_PEP_ID=MMETSP0174-20130528/3208_1 /TAXON_ID=216777 /ORGANISM="Proboscia alata, Strain PI-D3" /LENGTH=494 /DNA_ID=CAMNT_0039124485 /DNA_START=56 /DNA_END=1540 /DNA_ORIENTATION=-